MGARAPSFALALPASSTVAANAANAYGSHGAWQPRIVADGHELPASSTQHCAAARSSRPAARRSRGLVVAASLCDAMEG
ncbi:MAG TPA: hypothetical protein VHB97_26560 [Polyangia bacterium]|nr:hypothetical protein [Polyangia bacterium]